MPFWTSVFPSTQNIQYSRGCIDFVLIWIQYSLVLREGLKRKTIKIHYLKYILLIFPLWVITILPKFLKNIHYMFYDIHNNPNEEVKIEAGGEVKMEFLAPELVWSNGHIPPHLLFLAQQVPWPILSGLIVPGFWHGRGEQVVELMDLWTTLPRAWRWRRRRWPSNSARWIVKRARA